MYQAPNTARQEASWRNYVSANPASFGSAPSDEFRQSAHGLATPTRNLARDSTAFGTEPVEVSWLERVNGAQSPVRLTGASGVIRIGSAP